MINYCTNAMFGGETITTIVMIVFSAGLLLFLAWVLIDSLNNKTNKNKIMNEEPIKNEPNYLLGGSIAVAAIMIATGLIYSASLTAGAAIPAGSITSQDSHSAPGQPAAAALVGQPAPITSGGCGV